MTTDTWVKSQEFAALIFALLLFCGVVYFVVKGAFDSMLGVPVHVTDLMVIWILMFTIMKVREIVRESE